MLPRKPKGYIFGYLPINLIQALTALGVVVIYSRLLTPEQYGRYALAVILIQWLQSLLFYWLHGGVARFYEASQIRNRLSALLTTACGTALGLSGLLVMAVGLAAMFTEVAGCWLLVAGAVSLVARSLLLIGLEGYRAARRVRRYSWLEGPHCVLGLGLGALLIIRTEGGAAAALWGSALASLCVLALAVPEQVQLMRPLIWSSDEWRRLARYGLPLAASLLLNQIIASSDRFFIAWLMSEKAVGVYSVAYALADRPSTIVFNWVAMATLPLAFAAMEREGPAAARHIMENTGKSLVLLILPCTAGLAVAAAPLAAVMVGVDFRQEATRLIPWIALASLFYGGMVHYAAHAFQITENTRLLLFTYLIVLILNIAFNLLLIPPLGLAGAVVASTLTYALGFGLQLLLARRFFPIPLVGSHFIRAMLACGFMVATIQATAPPATLSGLIQAILLGIVSYGASALALNVADSCSWIMARRRRAWLGGSGP